MWYHEVVGNKQCAIVDTWWQTETGGNMLTPLPGVTPTKPGSATLPFFGVQPVLLNQQTGEEIPEGKVRLSASVCVCVCLSLSLSLCVWLFISPSLFLSLHPSPSSSASPSPSLTHRSLPFPHDNQGEGVLAIRKPWPGMARTVFGNHERYLNVYMNPYPVRILASASFLPCFVPLSTSFHLTLVYLFLRGMQLTRFRTR